MKHLRKDGQGDESLMGPIIFCTVMLIVSSFLVSQVMAMKVQVDEPLEGYDTIGGLEYNMWTLTQGGECNSTLIYDNAWDVTHPTGGIYADLHPMATFEKPEGSGDSVSEVTVFVVRNNTFYGGDPITGWLNDRTYKETMYLDMFILHTVTGPWYWTKNYWAFIPFEKVDRNQDGNASSTFTKLKHNFTLFIYSDADQFSFTTNLYSNNFNISLGVILGADLVGRQSFWTILGQLLTLQLPNMNTTMRFLIAIPLWTTLGFVAVTLVSRFVPFIGGG